MKARTKRSKRAKKRTSAKRTSSGKHRSLLAKVAVKIQVPPDVTDKQVRSKLKRLTAKWTNATYTTGPTGTIVDTPGGLDL